MLYALLQAPPPGERKLYLLIEGPSESSVKKAKQEIKQILETTMENMTSLPGGFRGGQAPGRYNVMWNTVRTIPTLLDVTRIACAVQNLAEHCTDVAGTAYRTALRAWNTGRRDKFSTICGNQMHCSRTYSCDKGCHGTSYRTYLLWGCTRLSAPCWDVKGNKVTRKYI